MVREASRRFQIDIRHDEGWFDGLGNTRLFRQRWLSSGDIKAVVIIVHGLFEHSGRYAWFAEQLAAHGFAVCAFDQRGHGKSEGLRGYVNRFTDFQHDLDVFCKATCMEFPGKQVFLFGHSVGGTIVTGYAVDHQDRLTGLIFSAATTVPGTSITRLSVAAARVLSAIIPKMGITDFDASAISRDKSVVEAYVSDPLVYCGKIRARLGAELINAIEKSLPARMPSIKLPALIMHGSEDRLSNIQGSRFLYDSIGSRDKDIKYYDGFHHEILNEPGREMILADILTWLDSHANRGLRD